MHKGVKKRVEDKDIEGLKYVFVDSLDVDPTFEEYEEDYNYCREHIPELFESYTECSTPIIENNQVGNMFFKDIREKWTDDYYWNGLKMDLLENFSEKRFQHMKDVAQVRYADKIIRIKEEREQERRKREQKEKHETLCSERTYNVFGNKSETTTSFDISANTDVTGQNQSMTYTTPSQSLRKGREDEEEAFAISSARCNEQYNSARLQKKHDKIPKINEKFKLIYTINESEYELRREGKTYNVCQRILFSLSQSDEKYLEVAKASITESGEVLEWQIAMYELEDREKVKHNWEELKGVQESKSNLKFKVFKARKGDYYKIQKIPYKNIVEKAYNCLINGNSTPLSEKIYKIQPAKKLNNTWK